MKTKRIFYWITTGLLCVFLAFAIFNYLTKFDALQGYLESLNYPSYLLYILIIAKALGIIALLAPIKGVVKEWAYAGLFFNFLFAFIAHYMAGDGEGGGAVIAMVLLMASYFLGKQVRPWIIRG
ncbi:DoxX family protein [Galbibacter mesophilus]|uniref:DoxX family protein n=1 Tax=Galbibacter mesophilus TaxID=379069 RepID=UPI00191D8D4B|nr:DoxX family protein [Galbibacter mesophilus]MCM5662216.1 DoxX family protein [Galbibacter mesophilus]